MTDSMLDQLDMTGYAPVRTVEGHPLTPTESFMRGFGEGMFLDAFEFGERRPSGISGTAGSFAGHVVPYAVTEALLKFAGVPFGPMSAAIAGGIVGGGASAIAGGDARDIATRAALEATAAGLITKGVQKLFPRRLKKGGAKDADIGYVPKAPDAESYVPQAPGTSLVRQPAGPSIKTPDSPHGWPPSPPRPEVHYTGAGAGIPPQRLLDQPQPQKLLIPGQQPRPDFTVGNIPGRRPGPGGFDPELFHTDPRLLPPSQPPRAPLLPEGGPTLLPPRPGPVTPRPPRAPSPAGPRDIYLPELGAELGAPDQAILRGAQPFTPTAVSRETQGLMPPRANYALTQKEAVINLQAKRSLPDDFTPEVDLTYGKGTLSKTLGKDAKIKFDAGDTEHGLLPGVQYADALKGYPISNSSKNLVVADPPFIIKSKGTKSLPKEALRYGWFTSRDEASKMYEAVMSEASRMLKPGGKLLYKIQNSRPEIGPRIKGTDRRTIFDARGKSIDHARKYDLYVVDEESIQALPGRGIMGTTAQDTNYLVFQKKPSGKPETRLKVQDEAFVPAGRFAGDLEPHPIVAELVRNPTRNTALDISKKSGRLEGLILDNGEVIVSDLLSVGRIATKLEELSPGLKAKAFVLSAQKNRFVRAPSTPFREVDIPFATKTDLRKNPITRDLLRRSSAKSKVPEAHPSTQQGEAAYTRDALGRFTTSAKRLDKPEVFPNVQQVRVGPPAETDNIAIFINKSDAKKYKSYVFTSEEIEATLARSAGDITARPRGPFRPEEILEMSIPEAEAAIAGSNGVRPSIIIMKAKPRDLAKAGIKPNDKGFKIICGSNCTEGNVIGNEYQIFGFRSKKGFNLAMASSSRLMGIFSQFAPRMSAYGPEVGARVIEPLWIGVRRMESSMSKYAKMVNDSIGDPKLWGILRDYKVKPTLKNGQKITEILKRLDKKGNWSGDATPADVAGFMRTPELVKVAKTFRNAYDKAGREFGIPPEKFIDEYVPRIKKAYKDTATTVGKVHDLNEQEIARIAKLGREHSRIINVKTKKGHTEEQVIFDKFLRESESEATLDIIRDIRLSAKDRFLQDLEGQKFSAEDMKFFAEFDRTGDMLNVEDNAFKAFQIYVRAGAMKRHVGDTVEKLAPITDKAFANDPLAKDSFQGLINHIRGIPTKTEIMLNRSLDRLTDFLGVPGLAGDRPSRVVASVIMDFAYMGALGLPRILAPLKNLTQLNLTAGEIGVKHTLMGIREAARKGKATVTKELEAAEILTTGFDRIVTDDLFMGTFRQGLNDVQKKLLYVFTATDRWNRAITYYGARSKFKELASQFSKEELLAGNIALRGRTKIFGGSKIPEGIRPQIKEALDEGAIDFASELYARHIVGETQYLYGSANTPEFFSNAGPVGRMLGVFSTWPLNYGKLWSRWIRESRGDAIMKHIAASAMLVEGGAAFNTDLSNWFLFGAMPTGPTPIIQTLGRGAETAVLGGQLGFKNMFVGEDPMLSRKFAQAGGQLVDNLTMFVPGGIAATNLYSASKGEKSWHQAITGLQPLPDVKQAQWARKARRIKRERRRDR